MFPTFCLSKHPIIRQWTLLAINLILASSLYAQPYQAGFVITQDGTRLDGYILYQDHVFNRQHCRFKSSPKAQVQSFSAEEIQGYGIADQALFQAAELPARSGRKMGFVEYLLKGKPSLLYYGNTFFVQNGATLSPLLVKADTIEIRGEMILRQEETYKKQLLTYFESCQDVSGAVVQAGYSLKEMLALFTAYYDCSGSEYQRFVQKNSGLQARLGLGLRGTLLTVQAQRAGGSTYYFEQSDRAWVRFLSPVLMLSLSYPKLDRRLAVRTGIAYSNFHYFISDVNDRAGEELIYEMDIQASMLEIPLQLQVNLSRGGKHSLVPYVFAGGSMNFILSFEGERKTTTPTDIQLSRNILRNRSSFMAVRVGIGSSFLLTGSLGGSVELFGDSGAQFAVPDDNDVSLTTQSLGLVLSVLF